MTTTESNGHGPVPGTPVQLPDLLPERNVQAYTGTPVHTREGSHFASQLAWAQRVASALVTGDSLLRRQPPSVTQVWARHVASARHFDAWMVRFPRYLWGVVHTPVYAAGCLFGWVTSSPPLLAVTAVSLFLIHQFL